MTGCDLVTSIARRILRCHLPLAVFACLSLMLCLISQCLYLALVQMASFNSDPIFNCVAKIFRVILFAFSAAVFVVAFGLLECRLFVGAHEDVSQYFDT